ncbi:hypothetical protein MCETE7_01396 [Acidimicrobiia bacterium]
MHQNQRVRSHRRLGVVIVGLLTLGPLAACGSGGSQGSSTTVAPDSTAMPTTTAPATTSTTVDPGTLPQTDQKPTADDPAFIARMNVLADAIRNNSPQTAISTFFPVEAYKQTKKNTNPAADWNNRLIASFNVDVAEANKKLGANAASAVFQGVTVANSATWVKPGEEYNVGPYWRVLNSTMNFTVGGKAVAIPLNSMISWRGQWYVVHLGTIR